MALDHFLVQLLLLGLSVFAADLDLDLQPHAWAANTGNVGRARNAVGDRPHGLAAHHSIQVVGAVTDPGILAPDPDAGDLGDLHEDFFY